MKKHPLPEWFDDAKLGMFIDWGLYSIGGWAPLPESGPTYPDWYLYNMYHHKPTVEYHKQHWGENFQRDDFIPLFKAEKYDPEALVTVAKEAGMKYIVPVTKHHDGFCLWPSSTTHRNAAKMGPKRDLILPLKKACEKEGMKFGFYFSLDEWEYPVIDDHGRIRLRRWNKIKDWEVPPPPGDDGRGKIAGKRPVNNFYQDYIIPQAIEFIDLYDPDLIWFDGEWEITAEERMTQRIVDYFYRHAEGRKQVLVNDRLGEGSRAQGGDFYTSEFYNGQRQGAGHKWEEIRSLTQSFGFNLLDTDERHMDSKSLIRLLTEVVSRNGNLLLVANLDGSGALPDIQQQGFKDLGDWLKINGEAIYATRPWRVRKEDDAIWFTQSKDGRTIYAICSQCPRESLSLKSFQGIHVRRVTMLGVEGGLEFSLTGEEFRINIPARKIRREVSVLRFELNDPHC